MAGNVKEAHYKIVYDTGGVIKPKGDEQEDVRNNQLRKPPPASMYMKGGETEEYQEGGSVDDEESRRRNEALASVKEDQSRETDVEFTDEGGTEVPVEQRDYVGDAKAKIKERREIAANELGLKDINYLQKDEDKDYVHTKDLRDDLNKYYWSNKSLEKYEELKSKGLTEWAIEEQMEAQWDRGGNIDYNYVKNPHPRPSGASDLD